MRDRNPELERHLTEVAIRAADLTSDHGLREFADARCMPGPVHQRDFRQELGEELADASNYVLWWIEGIWDRVVAGDADALDEYDRAMRSYVGILEAWLALRT